MSEPIDKTRRNLRGQVALRQGEIVKIGAHPVFPKGGSGTDEAESTLAVVASHDCDIAASEQTDPFVEFFPLRPVKKLNSKKTHGRNARSLQIEAHSGSERERRLFEIDASSRIAIPKPELWDRNFERPYSITPLQLDELTDWLAARYRRAALPNNFERRYKRVKDDFWSLICGFNHVISTVLFIFNEGQELIDLEDQVPYTFSIILVHRDSESSLFAELTASVERLFEERFSPASCKEDSGLELRRCIAASEDELSVANYRRGIRHRIDWLSYESEPAGAILNV